MKRLMPLLLVLALLLPSAPALAQDYAGYTISAGWPVQIWALDGHNAIVRCWPDDTKKLYTDACRLLWLRDGRVWRELPYYVKGATADLDDATFLTNTNGDFRVILTRKTASQSVPTGPETGVDIAQYRITLYDWTDDGLQNPAELETGWGYTLCSPLLAASRQTEQHEIDLRLYDFSGRLLLTGVLPGSGGHTLRHVSQFKKDGYLIETAAGGVSTFTCIDEGNIRYRICPQDSGFQPHTQPFYYPDGQGGFFAVDGNTSAEYTPLTVLHYDGSGRLTHRKELGGDRLVMKLFNVFFDAQTGHTVLYGSAVANSRRVYTVFALTLDENQEAVAWDQRALAAAYRDYSPKIYLAPDGSPLVFTSPTGADQSLHLPAALLPFDQLPPSADAALTWRSVIAR